MVAKSEIKSYPSTHQSQAKASVAIRRSNLIGRLALYSLTLFLMGCALVLVTSCLWLFFPPTEPYWLLMLHRTLLAFTIGTGFSLFVVLFVFHRLLVPERDFSFRPLTNTTVHVGLTAYNDEVCIGEAVQEFKGCPYVDKVIVVENNSQDNTYLVALESGADRVVTEYRSGYGSCCMRTLAESAEGLDDDDVLVLCEGDMTFSAQDIKKFLAYLENCDIVLGTRATQELRATKTQMDWLINPGNQIVAKMIQTRFWGTRLTDVGCTYRAMRVGSYRHLRDLLWVRGNHFSPHMFIEALKLRMRLIEIAVVFRVRGGESKGVGSNKIKAACVALRMLGMLYKS